MSLVNMHRTALVPLFVALALVLVVGTSPAAALDDTGISAKFRNLLPFPVRMYWESPQGPKDNGRLDANGGETSFQTYRGHRFFYGSVDGPAGVPLPETAGLQGHRIVIDTDQLLYVVRNDDTLPELNAAVQAELDWTSDYLKRTGRPWLAYWPRPPPRFPMWSCEEVGHTRRLHLPREAWHWTCDPKDAHLHADGCRKEAFLELECIAQKPRAFRVRNFVSDAECEWVKAYARPHLSESTVGNGENARRDSTRTSQSHWLHRSSGPVADALFRRAAAISRMPEELLHAGRNAESMNVLWYQKTEEYKPHYDWGSHGGPESRFVSIGVYFHTPELGGETGFPKVGLKNPAIKGEAVMFYDLLEDGNVDSYSLHTGEPVLKGEKWFGAMWLWDPHLIGGRSPDDVLAHTPDGTPKHDEL